jgi:type IV pilus assembly protein PilW
MAGYAGCANIATIAPNVIADLDGDDVADVAYSSSSAASGNESTGTDAWTPDLDTTLATRTYPPLTGTDVITVQFSQGCGAHLKGNMDAVNANIQIVSPNSCDIEQDDILLISDCVSSDVFRASSASSGGTTQTIAHAENINIGVNLSKPYQQDAEIFNFASRTYYIGSTAGGQPALWRLDNAAVLGGNNPMELVEGVENLQVLYGEDTDSDRVPNQYLTANNVANLANVVAVRISLLMRTLDNNIVQSAQTYSYDTDNDGSGESVTAGDRRLRRVFTTTINLRNRSP